MTEAMQQVIEQLFNFALKNGLKEITVHVFGENEKVKVSEYKELFKKGGFQIILNIKHKIIKLLGFPDKILTDEDIPPRTLMCGECGFMKEQGRGMSESCECGSIHWIVKGGH